MPLDQQATAKDLSPLTMDTYHKCPLSGSKVPLFFLFIIGFTRRDNGQLCWTKYIYLFIYVHFFVGAKFPEEKNFSVLGPTAWPPERQRKISAQIKSHSVLAKGDLGTPDYYSLTA